MNYATQRKRFEQALKSGHAGEDFVREFLDSRGEEKTVDPENINYDFIFKDHKWEIKTDYKAETTGNVAVEWTYGGKLKSHYKGECDIMAYVIGGEIYAARLKTFLKGVEKYMFRTVRNAGWKGIATIKLLKLSDFKKFMTLINGS